MSRPIRFRAWDKEKQRMHYDGFAVINKLNASALMMNPNLGDELHGSPWLILNGDTCLSHVLMQFTGLHDRRGKEIYEGDALQEGKEDWAKWIPVFAVEWLTHHTFCGWNVNQEITRRCEIIGNVYEHPELMARKESGT